MAPAASAGTGLAHAQVSVDIPANGTRGFYSDTVNGRGDRAHTYIEMTNTVT